MLRCGSAAPQFGTTPACGSHGATTRASWRLWMIRSTRCIACSCVTVDLRDGTILCSRSFGRSSDAGGGPSGGHAPSTQKVFRAMVPFSNGNVVREHVGLDYAAVRAPSYDVSPKHDVSRVTWMIHRGILHMHPYTGASLPQD